MWHTLTKLFKWQTIVIALVGFFALQASMGGYLFPRIKAKRPDVIQDRSLIMVDMKPLVKAEEVDRIFKLYTPDIIGEVRLVYAVDFLLPLTIAAFLIAVIGLALTSLNRMVRWHWLVLLPGVPVIFDYLENIIALVMLAWGVSPGLAGVVGIIGAIKWAGYLAVMAVAAILAVIGIGKFMLKRR